MPVRSGWQPTLSFGGMCELLFYSTVPIEQEQQDVDLAQEPSSMPRAAFVCLVCALSAIPSPISILIGSPIQSMCRRHLLQQQALPIIIPSMPNVRKESLIKRWRRPCLHVPVSSVASARCRSSFACHLQTHHHMYMHMRMHMHIYIYEHARVYVHVYMYTYVYVHGH